MAKPGYGLLGPVGQVSHLDRVAKRLLQLEAVDFPAGIRFNGHYENHLNADAVIILRYAWPRLDADTRARAARQIAQMLEWCLADSLQPDGSFKVSVLDDTTSDAEYYGVWFLDEAGYFDKQKRFWTSQDFPKAERARAGIAAKLKTMGLDDPQLKEAYDTLCAGPMIKPANIQRVVERDWSQPRDMRERLAFTSES